VSARQLVKLLNFSISDEAEMTISTPFLLMAQYGGKAIIPPEDVTRDYFSHLNTTSWCKRFRPVRLQL